ncbi:MAG TPA: SDR family NAD(P)-dependent oxidoreductase [Gaiellaceae bacterium]|nr:SDR family NAD(P)-dependent oxidoreductase [Gaiellaceae bacterium]
MNRFKGKHIAVTGAARGIGLAIAERLASEGARLTLIDRDEPRLDGATTRVVDIRDRDAVYSAFTEPLDALVANAGIGGANEPGDGDRFDEIVQTNLYGTYWCARAAEPLLADGGRIVVTSSILSRIGVAGYTAYCASKAGLLGLVRAFAAELAPRRIQVNAVCPGWVDTDMTRLGLSLFEGLTEEEAWEVAKQEVPLRRMSDPSEIAATVAWLLSDDSLGITGQAIDHNNGAFMS